ncbi:hypothetical protein HNQ77_002500 [Silvibacterium bohemicum]|uniref:Uncharacterized protein n=1 Tax=Silvibacterium bohemicum TaxID=1577686 RepID=A0A841K1M5_9BACT|nr:hypothetical protein [Silvibacterium bohemicum]MBB6144548.1 hypothetical protein [Silvibacterium bohemicum]
MEEIVEPLVRQPASKQAGFQYGQLSPNTNGMQILEYMKQFGACDAL